jgi:hypothetical protein
MRAFAFAAAFALLFLGPACSLRTREPRGIADKRTEFARFLPMKADPARDGLKPVRPYFPRANRTEILRAIERACAGGRSGSSIYDQQRQAGYYVNCNPKNRQLLNGYVAANSSEQPHSR